MLNVINAQINGDSILCVMAYTFRAPWITSGPRFNIKMTSYHYSKSHCGDKMILRPSYLHNGISFTDKMTSLYLIGEKVACGIQIYFRVFLIHCWPSSMTSYGAIKSRSRWVKTRIIQRCGNCCSPVLDEYPWNAWLNWPVPTHQNMAGDHLQKRITLKHVKIIMTLFSPPRMSTISRGIVVQYQTLARETMRFPHNSGLMSLISYSE